MKNKYLYQSVNASGEMVVSSFVTAKDPTDVILKVHGKRAGRDLMDTFINESSRVGHSHTFEHPTGYFYITKV